MKNELFKNTSIIVNNVGLKLKKHSPEILMAVGVVGTVASTVLACRATMKINRVMEEKNKIIEDIHTCLDDESVDYTEEDSKKDLTIAYAQTGIKLVKLYAPAVLLGALSVSSIISSHNILRKRNVALVAAYAAVDQGFKKYRSNVVDRFGKEIDRELRYNIKAKEIEVKTVDKNGKEKVSKEVVMEIENPNEGISDYAKFFDEVNSDNYTKDPEYNLMFLRRQQDYANELLKHRGHLFLNEVYDMLGIPRTKAGQVVGWIYNPKNPNGDNYVDFGIYDVHNECKRAFVNGLERAILLDFNVDGVIYDQI